MNEYLKSLEAVLTALEDGGTTQKQRNQVADRLKQMVELNREGAQLQLDSADMLMQVAKVSGLVVGDTWLHEANEKRPQQLEAAPVLKLVSS